MCVVGALLLAGCGGGSSSKHDAAPAAPPSARPAATDRPFRCPGPKTAAPPDYGADSLPNGAQAALVCVRDGGRSWTRPSDTLTTRVDALVRSVNRRPLRDQSLGCAGGGGIEFALIPRYAHGTRTVTGGRDPCVPLTVGTAQHDDARGILFGYLRALEGQRAQAGPPRDVARRSPSCHAPTFSAGDLLARPDRIVTAVVCTAGVKPRQVAALDRRRLAQLRRDFATVRARPSSASRFESKIQPPRLRAVSIGRDAWGDTFHVELADGHYRLLPAAHGTYVFARMLPATARMLGRLLGSSTPPLRP